MNDKMNDKNYLEDSIVSTSFIIFVNNFRDSMMRYLITLKKENCLGTKIIRAKIRKLPSEVIKLKILVGRIFFLKNNGRP